MEVKVQVDTLITTFSFLAALSTSAAGHRQPSEEELAKQSQNPVADLVSVPLQGNFNFGARFHHHKMIYVLNVQPVIPINISDEWNRVERIIMPIIISDPSHRSELLREGWKAVSKVFVIAVALDVVYQYLVFRWFYPLEALIVAFSGFYPISADSRSGESHRAAQELRVPDCACGPSLLRCVQRRSKVSHLIFHSTFNLRHAVAR